MSSIRWTKRVQEHRDGGCTVGISKKTVPQANDMCECGHAYEAHEHYRKGTECSICDVRACSEFSAVAVTEYSNAR